MTETIATATAPSRTAEAPLRVGTRASLLARTQVLRVRWPSARLRSAPWQSAVWRSAAWLSAGPASVAWNSIPWWCAS